MIRAYLFALDPTDAQVEALRSHCGAQRFAYNWGLARIKANLGQREAERSYGTADDELTPPVSWSAYSLRRDWNQAKDQAAPRPPDLPIHHRRGRARPGRRPSAHPTAPDRADPHPRVHPEAGPTG